MEEQPTTPSQPEATAAPAAPGVYEPLQQVPTISAAPAEFVAPKGGIQPVEFIIFALVLILVLAMFSGNSWIVGILIGFFALYGVGRMVMDARANKQNPLPTQQVSTPHAVPSQPLATDEPVNTTAKSAGKAVKIVLLTGGIILAAVYILPTVGILLLFLLMMIFGGGDTHSD